MAGITRSTFIEEVIAGAIDGIAERNKWSGSQVIAEALVESPMIRAELDRRGIDPDTLERGDPAATEPNPADAAGGG